MKRSGRGELKRGRSLVSGLIAYTYHPEKLSLGIQDDVLKALLISFEVT
jgi:hypothetical protein